MTAPRATVPFPRRSWADRSGLTGRSRAARILIGSACCLALTIAILGTLLPVERTPDRTLSSLAGAGLATMLVALGQLARLRLRIGRGAISVSWGEAAFIVGFLVAPPGWLPAATLVGATGAWLLLSWLNEQHKPAELAYLAASLSLGTAGATAVAWFVADHASIRTARTQVGLVVGASTYLLITIGLASALLLLHREAGAKQIAVRILHAKIPMFIGSLIVGLSTSFALTHSPFWLFTFVPGLWLLQRSYQWQLRSEQDRRMWEAFAAASAILAGGSRAEVVRAALRSAADVFEAKRVTIEVPAGSGPDKYTYESPSHRWSGPVITRTLAVGGEIVGELTVWLSEPLRPGACDEAAIAAFAGTLAGALHDAATRERAAALQLKVDHDAVHDQLTGLINRDTLISGGDCLIRANDRDRNVALLLLDVNDFREVNSTLGHRCGDEVLQLVAERLTDLSREHELVARTGDDEFAVLIPTLATLTDSSAALRDAPNALPHALRRARELVEQVRQPMQVSGVRLSVEIAVGVVVAKAGRSDLVELVRRAALALDQAKRQELAVAAYETCQDPVTTDRLALLAELQDALLADDEIQLHLQPAVDLLTATPTGVEALVRWQHPRRGQLSPNDFIRTVEHTELLTPFTRRVLDLALTAVSGWHAAGVDVPVSVNVSARSLLDPSFPAQVADALRRHRTSPDRLVLEITESVAVSDQAIVDDVLADLRATGVQLSLDDFGTGYSSLSIVTRVPVDEIKIDRSFVDEMIDSCAAEAVVRGAVELGARLGVRVVAEGVETTEQRAALIALGCPTAQGYHFCKPMPTDRIVQALTQLGDTTAAARIRPLRADDAS